MRELRMWGATRVTRRAQAAVLRELLAEEQFRANDLFTEVRGLRAQLAAAGRAPSADLRFVFLMTYGRSGSTLVQGILNTVPGVLLRGENDGMLVELWRFHRKGLVHRDRFVADRLISPRHPWYGIDGFPVELSEQLLRELFVQVVLRPFPDTRLVGCKEIRWPDRHFEEFMDWLFAVFPGARIVVNTRDLQATAASGWWERRPDALQVLAKQDARLRGLVQRLGERAFHVHYDDYVDDLQRLAPLHEWLGIPFDLDAVRVVRQMPHSYQEGDEPASV